jgi:hypothetical protein
VLRPGWFDPFPFRQDLVRDYFCYGCNLFGLPDGLPWLYTLSFRPAGPRRISSLDNTVRSERFAAFYNKSYLGGLAPRIV